MPRDATGCHGTPRDATGRTGPGRSVSGQLFTIDAAAYVM